MNLEYINTFIAVAEDSKAPAGTRPKSRSSGETVAEVQYRMLVEQPYQFTQADVLFAGSTPMRENPNRESTEQRKLREEFFSRSQACLRTSPLAKTYGWGIHFNAEGKAAAYGVETPEYKAFASDKGLDQTRAMRSKRA